MEEFRSVPKDIYPLGNLEKCHNNYMFTGALGVLEKCHKRYTTRNTFVERPQADLY
jgi:hypothetical protein